MNSTTFLRAIFACYPDESLRCEIRCLPPRGEPTEDRPPRAWYPLNDTSLEAAAKSCLLWSRKWDVYFGVLPRSGQKGDINSVTQAGWLWCDIDGGMDGPDGAIERLKAQNISYPQIAVRSGGGIHAYWRLESPILLPDGDRRRAFKAVLRRLSLKIGGNPPHAHADPSASDCARILRVPDTINHKRKEQPRRVELIRFKWNSRAFSMDAWDASLPPLPEPPRHDYPAYEFDPSRPLPDGLLRWAAEGYMEGKRHLDLVGAAAWLIKDLHLPESMAEELLIRKARASTGMRSITPDEIRKMVQWA